MQATAAGTTLAERMRRERTDAVSGALEALATEDRRLIEQALPALEALAETVEGPARVTRVVRAGRTTFAALSVPNYRRYYAGQSISLIGTWMQMTAQSWLVFSLTHSSTALGIVVALQTLPVLILGPYGGVVADRVDKRKLMIALQSAMGVQALALGVLTVSGAVTVWEIAAAGRRARRSTTPSRTRRASRSCSSSSGPSICATRSASTPCSSTSPGRSARRWPGS